MLGSCFSPQNMKKDDARGLYAVDSLVAAQIKLLTSQNAKIKKHVLVGEKIDSTQAEMDSNMWSNLFSPLNKLTINKPSVVDAYQEQILPDSSSNLTILRYELKEKDSKLNLKSFSIYYLGSLDNIKKITAFSNGEGYVYSSQYELVLIFDRVDSLAIITSFNIITSQKTLLKDSINWTIKTDVVY